VRDSLLKMADELLRLYAKRELVARPAYKPPGAMYKTFVQRFACADCNPFGISDRTRYCIA
jgi:transcription-repair coupling factor (superfamily II helicase)